MQYTAIDIIPKIAPDSSELLSLIYTPGVGSACLKIKDNQDEAFKLTNKSNSVAVISFDYELSLKRAVFLKNTLNIDAFPLETVEDKLKLVVENITPNFCGIDLSLISEKAKEIDFDSDIPILVSSCKNIQDVFNPVSKNVFMFNPNNIAGNLQEKALHLRESAGGVLECVLTTEEHKKPVAIVSDGTAVLGFGNIGPHSALPVMEGKAVLFKALGDVNAMPLCLNTQEPDKIIEIVSALKNSFSGINLEDISAPRCFEIETKLAEIIDIPVFHDDQHGTAIVVLAGLLNALSLLNKELSKVKIVISGAGAAGQAIAKLLLKAGATNITCTNKFGVVRVGLQTNDSSLEHLAKMTNPEDKIKTFEEAISGAEVFIGVSAPNVLNAEMVRKMAKSPIIFALANPTPEIMPEDAISGGAFIVATGRSDYPNQINNALAFPGLFKGLLQKKLNKVSDYNKIECAIAIASLVSDDEISPIYILPEVLDIRVPHTIAEKLN